MSTYAYIYNGVIWEIIPPYFNELGVYVPIEQRYPSTFIDSCVDITNLNPQPLAGWTATKVGDEWTFAPHVPTDTEIIALNVSALQQATQLTSAQKTALINRVGTLQDAIELEMATPAEIAELPVRQAQLLEWKRYAVFLGRVTTQTGWALTVEWPVQPTEGMDLTVSAVAKPVAAS